MREITFSRDEARKLFRKLAEEQAAAEDAGQRPLDLVMLAGAALAAANTFGAFAQCQTHIECLPHAEHFEMDCATRRADNLAIASFVADLLGLVACHEYDRHCEPQVRAKVQGDPDLKFTVLPIEGFRGLPGNPWYRFVADRECEPGAEDGDGR
jgi:hypothetical protein